MKTPSVSNQQEKLRSDTSKEMLERIFKVAKLIVNAMRDTGENCPKVQAEDEKTQK